MGIPIIQELWDGIRWIIDFFINKSPNAIKILFFLLFLLLFGSIISFFLHIGGIHCNSELQPVKTSLTKLITNLRIMQITNDNIIDGQTATVCDAHPDMCGKENECYYFARLQNDSGLYEECNVTSTDPNCNYLMKNGVCFNCSYREICFNPVGAFWFFNGFCTWHDVCISNAYYQSPSSQDFVCTGRDDCSVPKGYIWNITSGVYTCVNDLICGENATESIPIIDEYLEKANYKLLYQSTTNNNDYRKFISITCQNNLNPELSLFGSSSKGGFPIFNYKIWLFIIVIYVMFIFLSVIRKH